MSAATSAPVTGSPPNLRAEVEYGARPGTINENIDGSRGSKLGSLDQTSVMANLIFDIGPEWKVHPFVGVGAGVVQVKGDYTQTSSNNGHTGAYTVKADATVPAAQLLAGASWQITDRLNFDMTYRFLRSGNVTYTVAGTDMYNVTVGPNTTAVTDTYGAKAAGHFSDQSLTVGLRWTFGAVAHRARAPMPVDAPMAAAEPATAQTSVAQLPAAQMPATQMPAAQAPAPVAYAPPPMPTLPQSRPDQMPATVPQPVSQSSSAEDAPSAMTAAESRQFAVYFSFNSSRLNAAGKTVVAEAAQYAQSAPTPKVTVIGHTDTSGSAAYNAVLSERRAKAVAAGLREQGVPVSAMIVGWKGESDLAVPTRNGVARHENRRTTIDVEF